MAETATEAHEGDVDAVVYEVNDSTATVAQPGSGAAAIAQQAQSLSNLAATRQGSTSVMTNASPALSKAPEPSLPERLEEIAGVGHRRGKGGVIESFVVTLVRVGSFLMEKTTGYDFILMRRAALREANLTLRVNSAFRDSAAQQRIWEDRQLHPEKGPAAKPGGSGHEQGRSLDISTGIDFPSWESGMVLHSPVRDWLVANAHRFGFSQDIPGDLGKLDRGLPTERAYEPWHWTHLDDATVHGVTDAGSELEGALADILEAGQGAAYISDGHPDWLRIALKVGSDTLQSWSRSVAGGKTSRGTIYSAAAGQALLMGQESAKRSANQSQLLTLTTPKGFSGNPPLYDFTTGQWSDDARGV